MKTQKWLLAIAALMITPSLASAQGSGSQGGHGVKDKKSGKVRIADEYVVREEDPTDDELGERFSISTELHRELNKALRIMAVYANVAPAPKGQFYGPYNLYANEFVQNVYSADYRLVDEIPEDCLIERPKLKDVPEDTTADRMACTLGKQTYLVRSMFLNAESIREQVKSIIHERLHTTDAFKVLKAESKIADITDGLDLAMNILDRQVSGERPVLSEKEMAVLSTMQKRLQAHWVFGANRMNEKTEFASGGGLIGSNVKVGKDVYVGIATMLRNARVADSVTLIDSAWFCAPFRNLSLGFSYKPYLCEIGQNSSIVAAYNVHAYAKTRLGARVKINHVSVNELDDLIMGNDTEFTNTQLDRSTTYWSSYSEKPLRVRMTDGSALKNFNHMEIVFKGRDFNQLSLIGSQVGMVGGLIVNIWNPIGFVPMSAAVASLAFRHLPTYYADSYTLVIKDAIDAEGKPLCKSGYNIFRDNLGLKATINSKDEFVRRCEN